MLKIYNTLTNKKEIFYTIHNKLVNIYVCGPTVYDHLHIGNIRPLVFFSMVKSYLNQLNFKVFLVTNITDIDDKIIKTAIMNKKTEKYVADKYIRAFLEILNFLNIDNIDFLPKVTDFIPFIINYIECLIKKKYAYVKDQGIYFRVNKIEKYGYLSGKDINNLIISDQKQKKFIKEDHKDFILWKNTQIGIKYASPWFDGRPGWHTECVAMIKKIFNNTLDIHGGGNDLKFPHHENEIAQSMAFNNSKLSNFFMHVGRIDYKKNKMSKSLGNVIIVKDLLNKFHFNSIKLFLIAHHYRKPIEFNYLVMERFEEKYNSIESLLQKNNFFLKINNFFSSDLNQDLLKKFYEYMDDDFNTSNVITLIEQSLKKIIKKNTLQLLSELQNTLVFILKILGINIVFKNISKEIIDIYHLWQKELKQKNFDKSDYYRKILIEKGFI